MAEVKTDEEQVEFLKKWFDDNGTSLLVSIVVVLAAVFGYRTWETQQLEQAQSASVMYEELVQAVTVNDPMGTISEENISTGKFLASQLKQEHTKSSYAHFAAMHMAKAAVEAGDLEAAIRELQWLMDNGASEKLIVIANMRLARVKLAQGEFEAALVQLDEVEAGAHQSSYEELRGDILFALDRKDEAREAYQKAVNLQTNPRLIAQMKLGDLVVPRIEVKSDETDSSELPAAVVKED